MSRAALVLSDARERERATHWIAQAPPNTRVEFKAPKRTVPQNALMWVYLTKLAGALPWHGLTLTADDWKLIFLDALKQEVRIVPNINGTGFVNLGRSSSDLSKEEMGDLITLIQQFAAEKGVDLGDEPANDTAGQGSAAA